MRAYTAEALSKLGLPDSETLTRQQTSKLEADNVLRSYSDGLCTAMQLTDFYAMQLTRSSLALHFGLIRYLRQSV